jgi:hypothetical protein
MLDNWTLTVLSDPKVFAGLNVLTTNKVDINRVLDHL